MQFSYELLRVTTEVETISSTAIAVANLFRFKRLHLTTWLYDASLHTHLVVRLLQDASLDLAR